jgi:hypothetical protein
MKSHSMVMLRRNFKHITRNPTSVFTPATSDAITAIAWCVGIALVGYLWARSTFKKRA